MSIQRINPSSRLSQAVVHGDTIYIAGQVAGDTTADIIGQTRQILTKIEALLSEAGSDKSKLLSANIWLSNVALYDSMNSVWDAWVTPGSPPARATVGAPLAGPQYLVEIAAIAAKS
jgi:enamine deaminase RidA (YjgF/YER057c/UK114 family)